MTPVQQAYGLLWLSPQGTALTKAARNILRDTLSLEERQEAAQWAMKNTRRTAEGLVLALDHV